MSLVRLTYDMLRESGFQALLEVEKNVVTPAVEVIVELQINPDGKSPRTLVITTAEFRQSQQIQT